MEIIKDSKLTQENDTSKTVFSKILNEKCNISTSTSNSINIIDNKLKYQNFKNIFDPKILKEMSTKSRTMDGVNSYVPFLPEKRNENFPFSLSHHPKSFLNDQKKCELSLQKFFSEKKFKNFTEKISVGVFFQKFSKETNYELIINLFLKYFYNNNVIHESMTNTYYSMIRKNKEEQISMEEDFFISINKELVQFLLMRTNSDKNYDKVREETGFNMNKNEFKEKTSEEKQKKPFDEIYKIAKNELPGFLITFQKIYFDQESFLTTKLIEENEKIEKFYLKSKSKSVEEILKTELDHFNEKLETELENIYKADKSTRYESKELKKMRQNLYQYITEEVYEKINPDDPKDKEFRKCKLILYEKLKQDNFSYDVIEETIENNISSSVAYKISEKIKIKLEEFNLNTYNDKKNDFPAETRLNLEKIEQKYWSRYHEMLEQAKDKKNKKSNSFWEWLRLSKENFFKEVDKFKFKQEMSTMRFDDEKLFNNLYMIRKQHFSYAILSVFESVISIEEFKIGKIFEFYCFVYKYYNSLILNENSDETETEQLEAIKESKIHCEKIFVHFDGIQEEIKTKYLPFMKDFYEIMEKILDGDINSVLFSRRLNFDKEQTKEQFLYCHPIVMGLISMYEKLKNFKKPNNNKEAIYTDGNLPKMTFLNLDGYDQPLNYMLAKSFAKNLQIISLTVDAEEGYIKYFDEVLKQCEKTRKLKHFHLINMRNKESKNNEYDINSKDFWQIFQKIVFKLIANYNPSVIIMSHSFSFYKTINKENGLNLNPNTFSKILKKLCTLCNHKFVLFPNFSTIDQNIATYDDKFYDNWKNKFLFKTKENLFNNRMYLYELLGSYIFTANNLNTDLIKQNEEESALTHAKDSEFNPILEKIHKEKFNKKQLMSSLTSKYCDISNLNNYHKNLSENLQTPELGEDKETTNHVYFTNKFEIYDQHSQKIIKYELKISNYMDMNDEIEEIEENKSQVPEDSKTTETEKNKYYQKLKGPDAFTDKVTSRAESNRSEQVIDFYYSEKTRYFVSYDIFRIFFFNIYSPEEKYYNVSFKFGDPRTKKTYEEGKVLQGKKMRHYLGASENYLIDFSICFTNETLYLFWGRFGNLSAKEDSENNKINNYIYAYDIKSNEWEKLQYNYKENNFREIPRLKVACCAITRKEKDVIYVLGGTGFQKDQDIYNLVEIYTRKKSSPNIISLRRIPKEGYKDNYKPLNDSFLFFMESVQKKQKISEVKLLLMGGTLSPFICNQRNKKLSAYVVKISKDSINPYSVQFENCLNNLKNKTDDNTNADGLNLVLSLPNKNYLIDGEKKEKNIIFIQSVFTNEKKGIFLDKNTKYITENFFINTAKNKILNKNELNYSNSYHHNKTLVLALNVPPLKDLKTLGNINILEKFQSIPKFRYFMLQQFGVYLEKIDINHYLADDTKPELTIIKYKKMNHKNQLDASNLDVSYVGFSIPDLKKPNYLYSDYQPSTTKLTNYSRMDDTIYILVNNAKDNDYGRNIYKLNLRNVNLNSNIRWDLINIYSDNLPVKGTTLLAVSPDKLFIIGGQIANKQKFEEFVSLDPKYRNLQDVQFNIVYNFSIPETGKDYKFLPNNLKEMINPYAFYFKDHIISINRNYKNNKKYIYGEILNIKEDWKKWVEFKISVDNFLVRKDFSEEAEKRISYAEKYSIISLFSIGRYEKNEKQLFDKSPLTDVYEVFLVELNKNDKKINKIVLINLKKLIAREDQYNEYYIKDFGKEINDGIDTDECYHKIRDDFNDNLNDETKLFYFRPNFKVGNVQKYLKNIKKYYNMDSDEFNNLKDILSIKVYYTDKNSYQQKIKEFLLNPKGKIALNGELNNFPQNNTELDRQIKEGIIIFGMQTNTNEDKQKAHILLYKDEEKDKVDSYDKKIEEVHFSLSTTNFLHTKKDSSRDATFSLIDKTTSGILGIYRLMQNSDEKYRLLKDSEFYIGKDLNLKVSEIDTNTNIWDVIHSYNKTDKFIILPSSISNIVEKCTSNMRVYKENCQCQKTFLNVEHSFLKFDLTDRDGAQMKFILIASEKTQFPLGVISPRDDVNPNMIHVPNHHKSIFVNHCNITYDDKESIWTISANEGRDLWEKIPKRTEYKLELKSKQTLKLSEKTIIRLKFKPGK